MTDGGFDFDVCGFGSLNIDYVVPGPTGDPYFDVLGEGQERPIDDFAELTRHIARLHAPIVQIGGSAVNAVRAVHALDPELGVALVAPVGHLPDEVGLHELDGIDLSGTVRYDGPANSCVSVVVGPERKLWPYNDPMGLDELLVHQRDATVSALSRARLVHVTSLLGAGAGARVGDILEEVRRRTGDETQICVDLGQPWAEDPSSAAAILPHARLLLVSEEELRALVRGLPANLSRIAEEEAVRDLLREYRCRPDAIAILKRRAQPEQTADAERRRPRVGGVLYRRDASTGALRRDEVLRDGLDEPQIVDSTGAGDFFAAAVIAQQVSPRTRAVQTLRLATALARHKFGRTAVTAYADLDQVLYGRTVSPAAGRVFVSHSHADEDMVAALLDLFATGASERAAAFFCTSQHDTAIAFGQALDPSVVANLRTASFGLFVVTRASIASPACQREMGAAQALLLPTVPLRHPSFEGWREMDVPINFHRGVPLDDELQLRVLRDEIARRFNWSRPAESYDWDRRFQALQQTL